VTGSAQNDLQRFLFDFVESPEDLRILAWFRHFDERTFATEAQVVKATGVQDLIVVEVLERLVVKGVLEREGNSPVAFRYAPPNRELSAELDVVLERCSASLMDILRIMSANSIERVRLAALRTLADTLRVRGPRRR